MIVFPSFIAETSLRPDIVIWSRAICKVIIIELTVPAETNLENANHRKCTKYSDLVDQCQANKWEVHFFLIDIGSRGFAYGSIYKCIREMGFDNKVLKKTVCEMSKTALRCSYTIYLSRRKFEFQKWQMTETLQYDNIENKTTGSAEGSHENEYQEAIGISKATANLFSSKDKYNSCKRKTQPMKENDKYHDSGTKRPGEDRYSIGDKLQSNFLGFTKSEILKGKKINKRRQLILKSYKLGETAKVYRIDRQRI